MLADEELSNLEGELVVFQDEGRHRYNQEQEILRKYDDLIKAYRSLRSDFEDQKELREKFKQEAQGQKRNPFVLVLIDLDGYIFNDHLIRCGEVGGLQAAQLLKQEVKESLPRIGIDSDQCRIMVRGYTNLAGLSKALAKQGLVGPEKRALAPFAASFTRGEDLFDIVDAGEKKEGADFKIREMFRLFADNSQCRHIYFAGCHDAGYISLLTPFRGRADKISVVRAAAFSPEYLSIGLGDVAFPSVFRTTPLPSVQAYNMQPKTMPTKQLPESNGSMAFTTPHKNKLSCLYFQQGRCKYGRQCTFAHVAGDSDTSSTPDLQAEAGGIKQPLKLFKKEKDQSARKDISSSLPVVTPKTEGLIPINKDGKRIDPYLQPPSAEDWTAFNQRIKNQKLCNPYHLTGYCPNEPCQYDHTPVSPELIHVLKYMMRSHPCSRRGNCRSATCFNSHICQKDGCLGGIKNGCRLNHEMHISSPNVAEWVVPITKEQDEVRGDPPRSRDNSISEVLTSQGVGLPTAFLNSGQGKLVDIDAGNIW